VTRQTWRANSIAATTYVGSASFVRSQCANPSENGPEPGGPPTTYTLTVTSNTFTLHEDSGRNSQGVLLFCNWNGTYTQAGRLGAVTGTVACENNVAVPFTMTDLQINSRAFSANMSAQEPAPSLCRVEGRMGGVRR